MAKLSQQLGFVLAILLGSVFSLARELPYGACDGSLCGEEQRLMFKRFIERGVGIEAMEPEAVYAGVCRWSGLYSPEHEHHAGFYWYLTPETGELAFKGRLSHFAASNPYTDVTPEMAKEKWFSSPKDFIPINYDEYAFYDMNPEGEPNARIYYWFRADFKDPNHLYMVVIQGRSSLGVCELDPNRASDLQ